MPAKKTASTLSAARPSRSPRSPRRCHATPGDAPEDSPESPAAPTAHPAPTFPGSPEAARPFPQPSASVSRLLPVSGSAPAADTNEASALGSEAPSSQAHPALGSFAHWLQQADSLGLSQSQRVWELHIVQGRHLAETARLLGLTAAQTSTLYQEQRRAAAASAPQSEEDIAAVREEMRQRLISIIEDASRAPEDPRLLSIRQRACDQIADLYGLKLQRRSPASSEEPKTAPYLLPAELAPIVEQHILQLYGRRQEITQARQAILHLPSNSS